MPNFRRNLAVQITTPGGDNPLLLDLVTPPGKPPFYRGVAFSGVSLQGRGGVPPYAYSILSGALPTGLSLNGITGAITGTPTVPGHYTFIAKVQDSAANVYNHRFSIDILSALYIIQATPNPGEETLFYRYQFFVVDGGGTPVTSLYFVSSGTIPDGLALSTSGELSGTITGVSIGTNYFTVTLVSGADTLDMPCIMEVYPQMVTVPDTNPYILPNPVVGVYYSHKIVGGGGLPPYRFMIATDFWTAIGLKLANDGTVNGTPTMGGLFTSSFNATDALQATNVSGRVVPLRIIDPQNVLQPQKNSANVGVPGPVNWNLTEGSNISISSSNDGTTVSYTISASTGPVGGFIGTVNGIGPDSSGDFQVTSLDMSVTITPNGAGIDLSVAGTPSGTAIESINGLGPDSGGNISLVSHDGSVTIHPDSHGDIDITAGGSTGAIVLQLGPPPGTTAPIVAAQVVYLQAPAGYILTGWQVYVYPAATLSADVRHTTFGATLPIAGDSMTSGHPITTTAGQTNTGNTSLWASTAIARGDWLAIALTANDVGKFISIELQGKKT